MIDADGYVTIVERAKDLAISGGYNVYPKEVETEIDALQGGQDLSPEAIQTALRDRPSDYKLPKAVVFVDELPRNTMGKVQKNALRDQYKDAFAET